MLTPKSRAGKTSATPAKSRATKVRNANTAKPRSAKASVTPSQTPDLVVAGISAVAVSEQVPVMADTDVAAGGGAEDGAGDSGPGFKKKHLIERVHALSGAKKRDIKDIVEATLAAIGEALANGDALNLPPLGKLTVNRQKDLASGEMMIVKIRRQSSGHSSGKKPGKDPLADDGEDG